MADFAGFQVLGRVAQGSTGVVWQARQVELDRLVAIKELEAALLRAPGFLERFRAEAQTLATLDDPHVVRVYDYVEEPDRAYLVQEWVDGASLAAVLQEHGTLSPEQSLGVLRGGLIGLGHAHQRDLVHRDVSPANILLDRAGTSKLIDFGLAALIQQGRTPGSATSVGTPAFASPEAVTGAPMTTRSDVYSAAAVLYLLLSGRPPYPGHADKVLQDHLNAPVPRLDGHGPRLADLIARGMSKNPAERPADAAAFLAELEEAATERCGSAWLSRASVAGLVTAATAATATAAVSGGAALPAAAAAVAYGANSPATGAQLPATAARAGRRILGLPVAAGLVIAALVIAAVATTVIVTTSDDSPSRTAADADSAPSETEPTSQPSATTTEPPPPPAFSGTYSLVITITSVSGAVRASVGDVQEVTWTATATCPSGPCDVNVASSSGRQFHFSYADGSWTAQTSPASECLDDVTGEPIGTSVPTTQVIVLTPAEGVDPDGGTPILALSGTFTDTADVGCDGAPTVTTSEVQATRVGD